MLPQAAAAETADPKPPITLPETSRAEPWGSSRRLLSMAIGLSVVLHAAAAAAMLVSTGDTAEEGLGDLTSEAISIEKVHTFVLESIATEPLEQITTASAATVQEGAAPSPDAEANPVVEAEEVVPEPEPERPVKAVKTAELTPAEVVPEEEPLHVLSGGAEPVDLVEAQEVKEVPDEAEEEAERVKRVKRRRELAMKLRSRHQVAGGATSRSNAGQAEASAPMSASRGSLIKYARRARIKIARHKPPGKGTRGVVQISFAVSLSGELEYARLKQSSGNKKLDDAAVAAVKRAAPFGRPPPGSRPEQLRFLIPFDFR